MIGIKYLLDTTIIIGVLKQSPNVIAYLSEFQPILSECAYSAITRMELLGFAGITADEDQAIRRLLDAMQYLELTTDIEDETIQIRRGLELKLPDAMIAATARVYRLKLLTLDQKLFRSFSSLPSLYAPHSCNKPLFQTFWQAIR